MSACGEATSNGSTVSTRLSRTGDAEDDDLGRRLFRSGASSRIDLGLSRRVVHLWHPRETSTTPRWRDGQNVGYFLRRAWLTRCRNGLTRRPSDDLTVHIAGTPMSPDKVEALWKEAGLPGDRPNVVKPAKTKTDRVEVEILFLPSDGRFSGCAEFQILVLLDDVSVPRRILKSAQRIVANRKFDNLPADVQFPLADFRRALDSIV